MEELQSGATVMRHRMDGTGKNGKIVAGATAKQNEECGLTHRLGGTMGVFAAAATAQNGNPRQKARDSTMRAGVAFMYVTLFSAGRGCWPADVSNGYGTVGVSDGRFTYRGRPDASHTRVPSKRALYEKVYADSWGS